MISWYPQAWEDYLYWQQEDKRILKRINALIKDIQRSPFEGIGKLPVPQDPPGVRDRQTDRPQAPDQRCPGRLLAAN